jgi:methyl-galactoside transport system substrate-binding protein
VFNNREPLYEDLCQYDKAYYVGNDPKESGLMSGGLIARYAKEHPEADKNGDGMLQYVMLKGEPGHQDAELRTVYSVRALKDAGIRLEKLQESTAMWERAVAQEKTAGFIASFGDRIECVISNNDEMALGAIEALKAAGYFAGGRFIPVVGVDATGAALDALREGTLLGTVLNDAEGQGDAALTLALMLRSGESLDAFPYAIDRDAYVWIPSKVVTRETLSSGGAE